MHQPRAGQDTDVSQVGPRWITVWAQPVPFQNALNGPVRPSALVHWPTAMHEADVWHAIALSRPPGGPVKVCAVHPPPFHVAVRLGPAEPAAAHAVALVQDTPNS